MPQIGDHAGDEQQPAPAWLPLRKSQLTRQFRSAARTHVYHESAGSAEGIAIYTLSDPRDVRQVRYVGQTGSPLRRYLQHLNSARLWLPDEVPWWVPALEVRPLYEWIRLLHRDKYRLPCMLIADWAETTAQARSAERSRIHACLAQGMALLNVESELLGPQLALL